MDEQDATQPKATPGADDKPTDPAPAANESPKAANGVPSEASQANEELPEEAATATTAATDTAAPKAASAQDRHDTAELSPTRDSSSASISSVDPDMLGEIVVGTHHHNGDRLSSFRPSAERDDEDMADASQVAGSDSASSHYPKRKRSVVYADLGEDKMDSESVKHDDDDPAAKPAGRHPLPKRQGNKGDKGITIGYWRDSTVPSDENKHAVIGFMDVRERLRTRIQMQTVSGAAINARLFPIPPGPGGSWVTFERIVFLDHLVGHDHNVVKEYVKLRPSTSPDKSGDAEALEQAIAYLQKNPPPETAQPLQIAWGKEIPEHAQSTRDPQFKRRRTGDGITTIAAGTSPIPLTPQQPPMQLPHQAQQQLPSVPTPQSHHLQHQANQRSPHHMPPLQVPTPPQRAAVLDSLPGTRPTRILVGHWAKSDAPLDKDKHAVYGILGANDMFRVKLVRETMDGRFVEGNFPQGAGALWIAYEEVNFLPHLQGLTRPETKEYVRVRQAQLDAGETEAEKVANETKAVYEAQARVAANPKTTYAPLIVPRHAMEHSDQHMMDAPEIPHKIDGRSSEARQARREQLAAQQRELEARHARYSMPEPDMNRGHEFFERQRGIVDRAMTRMEHNQERDDRYAASRAAISTPPLPNPEARRDFQDNIQRMQKVWMAQETGRMRAMHDEDSKIHAGVKYERRANGPFAGKLVSAGTIISIDGEDYVEYRVLTKPTFI